MLPAAQTVTLSCPAKINLTLAVLGLRNDGFHDLHSVVAQTDFGDTLSLEWNPDATAGKDIVVVTNSLLPESENSVAKVLRKFRRLTGFNGGSFTVNLDKRIPVGSGLGGGSSDATAMIKALREVTGSMGSEVDWPSLAAEAGSDCPLFLHDGPVLMEGRGEQLTPLEPSLAGRLSGQPVVLFKPRFSIDTTEAYRRLASHQLYTEPASTRDQFQAWKQSDTGPAPRLNDFERLLAKWMPSLAIVLERLREKHGLDARLSGSGSACFVFSGGHSTAVSIISKEMERAWGEVYWVMESNLK